MSRAPISAVVLAAGAGTRMRSNRPKPLHRLCGTPLVVHVLQALEPLELDRVVMVVGHHAERVTKTLQELAPPSLPLEFVEQMVQRGTGDAVSVGLTSFPDDGPDELEDSDVLVLPGDTPLLTPETLAALVDAHHEADAAATLLTAELPDPTGYGRVIRGRDERVSRVVEEGDATEIEKQVNEVNTSIYCFRRSVLAPALRRLSPENSQGEYYLTDVISVLYDAGYRVISLKTDDPMEVVGVNDRSQLAAAESELRRRINRDWMIKGVTMLDPARTSIDSMVELGPDVTLLPGTLLQGRTVVESGAEIGPDTHLLDCHVGVGAVVRQTSAVRAEIEAGAKVGPFAALAPGTRVAQDTVTGPFFTGVGEDEV